VKSLDDQFLGTLQGSLQSYFDTERLALPAFRIALLRLPSYRERVMGQQHRVRVKRRRRSAYLDRKKAAAKAAPIRRELPKTKIKPKKQVAPVPET
jgi:hypothetical protein